MSFSGAVLAMSVKTSSRSAVLAYNAGAANSNDFVAVEVRVADNYLVVEAEALMTRAMILTTAIVTKAIIAGAIKFSWMSITGFYEKQAFNSSIKRWQQAILIQIIIVNENDGSLFSPLLAMVKDDAGISCSLHVSSGKSFQISTTSDILQTVNPTSVSFTNNNM